MTLARLHELIDHPLESPSVVKSNGVRVHDVFIAIEEGEPLDELASRFGLSANEVIAVFSHETLGAPDEGISRLIRGKPALPKWVSLLSESALKKLLPELAGQSRLALSAGMLQAMDLWDQSHDAAQEAEDRGETFVSAYWHGIAHRREPDAGNASYWFRRVGAHPVFSPLADAARPMLSQDQPTMHKLLPGGTWNPFAFIQLTTNASPTFDLIARKIQRAEMELLLAASIQGRA